MAWAHRGSVCGELGQQASEPMRRRLGSLLGQGLALALEQVVAGLGALELALHDAQRLARGEDGLPRLRVVLAFCRMAWLCGHSFRTYPAARHCETLGRRTGLRSQQSGGGAAGAMGAAMRRTAAARAETEAVAAARIVAVTSPAAVAGDSCCGGASAGPCRRLF